jgi:hypothetical protein
MGMTVSGRNNIDHFAVFVVTTRRTDMMRAACLTAIRALIGVGRLKRIVRAAHAGSRSRFLILSNSHDEHS